MILSLDSSNAFNCLSREQLFHVLLDGYNIILKTPTQSGASQPMDSLPQGWNLLWHFIASHYATHGKLRFFHSGTTSFISSQSGVQQGDPLGSTLFALAIHPVLLEIGRAFPDVLITAYADNVIVSGPLSQVKKAHLMYHSHMSRIGLKINSHESELYIPQWRNLDTAALSSHDAVKIFFNDLPPVMCLPMLNDDYIPIAQSGLKIVGVPLGTHQFCQQQLQKTILSIKADLDLLKNFDFLHQRVKLALYCCNTRITYLLRATPLVVSTLDLPALDTHFEDFMASTLHFEENYAHSQHSIAYKRALCQIRHGIKCGGFGLTSSLLVAPAASYVALRDFNQWNISLASLWGQASILQFPWLKEQYQPPDTAAADTVLFPYIQRHFAQALSTLSSDWNIHGHPQDDSVQNVITSQMKALAYQDFLDSCPSDDRARITAVGLQTIPTRCSTSQICPVRVPGSDHLDQCPMSLFSLMCPFELSNQAFVTSMSICLGVPVPHARFLTFTEQYADIDVWADFLLTDAAHASRSRKNSHDRLAYCLSKLAARAGLSSSAIQSTIPVAEEDTFRRGDIVTSVAGLSASTTYRFSSQTQLITDVTLLHPFSALHIFKPDSLGHAESLKNRSYRSAYNDQGMAFAPLACNSFGQQAPELLRYQWVVADRAAQRYVSLPTFSLPLSAEQPGNVDEHTSLLHKYKQYRRIIYHQSVQEVLVAIYEAVTERVFGRTHALQMYPEYEEFFRRLSTPWQPVFRTVESDRTSPPPSPPSQSAPPPPSSHSPTLSAPACSDCSPSLASPCLPGPPPRTTRAGRPCIPNPRLFSPPPSSQHSARVLRPSRELNPRPPLSLPAAPPTTHTAASSPCGWRPSRRSRLPP